jgi:hypothetical protein
MLDSRIELGLRKELGLKLGLEFKLGILDDPHWSGGQTVTGFESRLYYNQVRVKVNA